MRSLWLTISVSAAAPSGPLEDKGSAGLQLSKDFCSSPIRVVAEEKSNFNVAALAFTKSPSAAFSFSQASGWDLQTAPFPSPNSLVMGSARVDESNGLP